MIDKILKGYENLEKASLEAQKNEIEKTKEIEKLVTQESDASFDGHLQLNDDGEPQLNEYTLKVPESTEALISSDINR